MFRSRRGHGEQNPCHTVVQMNLWEFWDVLHGANRDVWLNITHHEMKPLSLLHLMVMNLPHGPDETDLRFKQTTDFMNDHYAQSAPEISPCFQEHYPEMLKQFGHLVVRNEGESMMQAMWRYCKANSVYKKRGARPTLLAMVQSWLVEKNFCSSGARFSLKLQCQPVRETWSKRSSWTGSG